jgi:hypothetical protein
MKVIAKRGYTEDQELWFGIPTWDPAGRSGERSVKFAYKPPGSSRWARTSPEVPESVVWDMIVMLKDQSRLRKVLGDASRERGSMVREEIESVMANLSEALSQVGRATG